MSRGDGRHPHAAAGLGQVDSGNTETVTSAHPAAAASDLGEHRVIVLGVILLLIGLVAHIAILWTIGLVLIIIGAVLWLLGSMGRGYIGSRRPR
jgi:hypothetical protein